MKNAIIVTLSIALLSSGLFYCLNRVADRIEERQQKVIRTQEKISATEVRVVEILADYYGDGIKRLDKIPSDSLDVLIKNAGY